MSLGTVLPLLLFFAGYVLHLTLVGGPISRQIYSFGVWTATLGQPPPKRNKPEPEKPPTDKKPFLERIRPYTPTDRLRRRGRPLAFPLRVFWFVLIGWWLGAVWVLLSWSVFLAPYPFLETVNAMLGELPSIMTLAYPEQVTAKTPRSTPGPATS